MEKYLEQLLSDIASATENASFPISGNEISIHDWISEEEENLNAPICDLEEWTGISSHQLPPADVLIDSQISLLLTALKKMLDAYNCSFVLQTEVPDQIQYTTIRENFSQQVKVKIRHMGFFELCKPGTEHRQCALGKYCQCSFYEELFSGFTDEELSPEEERARALEIEVNHIKRKYGEDWEKYYPYHLDAKYDDENGRHYNYGFDDGDEEDEDDWWRK